MMTFSYWELKVMSTQNAQTDVLNGTPEIAEFLGVSRRRAYYLCETRQIPAGKMGRRWVARKSRLLEHIDRLVVENTPERSRALD